MERTRLHLLLLGKTGEGKSSTGNTILGKKVFKGSRNTSSQTKDVDFYYADFGNYDLWVVDQPGLEDTEMDKLNEREKAIKNMDTVLGVCHGGVDAFLLVFKFGNKFTTEDKETLQALSQIYGMGYMKHVVVVVTCGDQFQIPGDDEEIPDQGFHEWCGEQEGAFKKLYEDCEGRFVLFNNKEIDEEKKKAQVEEVVQAAHDLQNRYGRYTSDSFKKAEYKREKMILQLKAPQLKKEFQEKICKLSKEIVEFSAQPSDGGAGKVQISVHDLRKEIEQHDKGYKVLEGLLEMMTNIEEHLNDREKLKALDKELEEIRKAKNFTGRVKNVFTGPGITSAIGTAAIVTSHVAAPVAASAAVGVAAPVAVGAVGAGTLAAGATALAAVALPVAALGSIGAAVYCGLEQRKLNSKEKEKVQERKKLKNKIKPLVTEPPTHT